MSKPVDMNAAKKRLERKKYAALVLGSFDAASHAAKRKTEETRAEVERKARNQL